MVQTRAGRSQINPHKCLKRQKIYGTAAEALAEELVSRAIELMYGGANVGLMGVLADRVLELGGSVIGVIPESLVAVRGQCQARLSRTGR